MDENIQVLEQEAIDAAIAANWKDAVALNQKIIQLDKKNLDAYMRLAFAYLQKGAISFAKKYYKKSLKLQPGSSAIAEYLERIKILESKKGKKEQNSYLSLDPNLFLETPGKTKSITLVNPGQKNILAQLTVGQQVFLIPKKRKIEIRTKTKEYIGSLPDDISKRLTLFIKAGSEFSAYIKEASLTKAIIFIREEKKGRKVIKYTSFPSNIQSHLTEMTKEDEQQEDVEDINENDLDKLAEILASEEKEYLPYRPEGLEEEEEEREE